MRKCCTADPEHRSRLAKSPPVFITPAALCPGGGIGAYTTTSSGSHCLTATRLRPSLSRTAPIGHNKASACSRPSSHMPPSGCLDSKVDSSGAVLFLGDPITDIVARVDEEFLQSNSLEPGGCMAVSSIDLQRLIHEVERRGIDTRCFAVAKCCFSLAGAAQSRGLCCCVLQLLCGRQCCKQC